MNEAASTPGDTNCRGGYAGLGAWSHFRRRVYAGKSLCKFWGKLENGMKNCCIIGALMGIID